MAKVSLRNYNREIGTLIEQGQTEEAVGHCHHILKTFPKHLETYRLLGKAYLEARRYNDAADIFSRTIMSVPDDFVSHVGMSLIADEKEKHDEAIWHMERAFESQPSNAAVQGELQRLYGRRDGVEPPKVRMTSGALANVYMQGELYPQAIAEIMSVESRDPGRVDMQVLLSKAYFRSGQQVEASQIASDLLTKRPYCFDANRILVEVLPGTSRSESTQTYRHRINSLDPYAAFIKDSVFNIDDVPDAAVNLERLDWKPGSSPQLASGWGETLGIKLDQDEEEQPAWLKVSEDDSEFGSASASEEQADEENIPDFMRDAGWDSSSGAPEEESSIFDEPLSKEEEIAQGELPDWMKSMAPSDEELADVENLAGEEIDTGNDMVADKWMDDLLSGNAGKKPDESPKEDPIADMGFTEDQPSLEEEVDLPNWFGEDEETSVEEVVSTPGDEISPLAEIETSPDIADESLIADPSIGELGASSDDQDAALNWLEGLAANQGANPEELITDPNARTEDAPEWVQKAQD
ncbi:MAG: tetratricopeptide repeat protein, partial [Anaerolineales bacterium]|nr:tetratricopeptide repeat protein [Candidatus Desulfolinea nitratireducens]